MTKSNIFGASNNHQQQRKPYNIGHNNNNIYN